MPKKFGVSSSSSSLLLGRREQFQPLPDGVRGFLEAEVAQETFVQHDLVRVRRGDHLPGRERS